MGNIQLPTNIRASSVSKWKKFSELKDDKNVPKFSIYFIKYSKEPPRKFSWTQEILHIGMSYKAQDKLKDRIKAFRDRGYKDKYKSNCYKNAEKPRPKFNADTFYYAYFDGELINENAKKKYVIRGIVMYLEQVAFGTYQKYHKGNVPKLNRWDCGLIKKKKS